MTSTPSRHRSSWNWEAAGLDLHWWSAGALTASSALGDRYAFVATDFADAADLDGDADPRTRGASSLQHVLARATSGLALFPAVPLAAALADRTGLHARTDPARPGYFPLDPTKLDGVDAVAFLTLPG
ncbi:hypothetical protein [Microtetraspora niveoalba]|uniref:hypothetical protein n=1 Tax=Microtetraspora niveoalba TaxID=46175 RepID=UPI00082C60B3|nr:hypothetical protein [Microtetraspora niveoalba]